jgi:peptide chain release factor 3
VVAFRLRDEYQVQAVYEPVNIYTARWIESDNSGELDTFKRRSEDSLAEDGAGHLTYLASSRVNLSLAEERFPEIQFLATREH